MKKRCGGRSQETSEASDQGPRAIATFLGKILPSFPPLHSGSCVVTMSKSAYVSGLLAGESKFLVGRNSESDVLPIQ